MEYIKLKEGIEVAPVCLGAMNFGTTTDKKSAYAVLDAYIEAGGNFIDTSNNYAHWQGTGDESETLLGEYFRDRGNRDKLVIATKVGFDRHGKGQGLKKEQIAYWIDESLRKLGTDHIDIYYAHTDDTATPLEETMEAFDRLVKAGKVRMLGGSNYDTWRFAEANNAASKAGGAHYEIMQQRFSYLGVRGDMKLRYIFNEFTSRERLRYLKDKNIPLVAYSCLAGGGYADPSRFASDYIVGGRYETIKEMAADKGVSVPSLVVSYLTNFHRTGGPRVIPLFASSKPEHFIEAMNGIYVDLSDSELTALDDAQ